MNEQRIAAALGRIVKSILGGVVVDYCFVVLEILKLLDYFGTLEELGLAALLTSSKAKSSMQGRG